jgi:hypothetical protein
MDRIKERLIWAADDITSALTRGTTLPTRLFLALAMILYAAGFFANQATWLQNPTFASMNEMITLPIWGLLYGLGGTLMLWRVMALKSNVICAWIINVYVMLVWTSSVIIRYWGIGPASLGSLHTALFFTAVWILLRTEANPRDKETS